MKKFLTGAVIGSMITCGVFYFISKNNDDKQSADVSALLEIIKQKQATDSRRSEAINKGDSLIAGRSSLSIVMAGADEYYIYRGIDCNRAEKLNLESVKEVLSQEVKQKKESEVMILIKPLEGDSFKNSVRLLDAIAELGITPGHFAEMDLSETEKNCIKNYKQ